MTGQRVVRVWRGEELIHQHGPDCDVDHAAIGITPGDRLELRPKYTGWALDQDPLDVQLGVPDPPFRPPWSEWERAYRNRRRFGPISRRLAWLGFWLCLAVLAVAAYLSLTPQSAAVQLSELPGVAPVARPSAELEAVRRPTSAPTSAPTVLVAAASPASLPGLASSIEAVPGVATWYCNDDPRWPISRCPRGHGPGEFIAAINPDVVDLPMGTAVVVHRGTLRVAVTIADTCRPCLATIDLSRIAFSQIADPGRGRVAVTVEWGDGLAQLPPTDTPDQHPDDPPEHPDDARMRLEVRD